MDNTYEQRRTRMLEKVRKLLAMGTDSRGNSNESETAMRQANKLMAEFGIEESEIDMQALDRDELVYGEVPVNLDGMPAGTGKAYTQVPAYIGILSLGVAIFTDTIAVNRRGPDNRISLVYRGEKGDVILAKWLFCTLVKDIRLEQVLSGFTTREHANSFRTACASTLQGRMKALRAERQAMYQSAAATGNRALVVLDRKQEKMKSLFGEQSTKKATTSLTSSSAAIAGHSAGKRINIPQGKPLEGPQASPKAINAPAFKSNPKGLNFGSLD